MATLVEQLVEAAMHGSAAFTSWLEQHMHDLSPQLADGARQVFKQAINARRADVALAAVQAAAIVYLRLGRHYEALSNYLDYFQMSFMVANTGEAYAEVRDGVLDIVTKAEEIEAEDLAFQAAQLAAEAAFFASQSMPDAQTKVAWIKTALADLVTASAKARFYKDVVWFQKYVSLLAVIVDGVQSSMWLDQEKEQIEAQLRFVAEVVEHLIPVEFEFPSDPSKTNNIARSLASLSFAHGSLAVASARLYIAMQRAEEAGDIETWMQTAQQRYVGVRAVGLPDAHLAQLQRLLRARAEQLRVRFRSRAGRLWAAQELDQIFGELLRDEFDKPLVTDAELFEMVDAGKARTLLDLMSVGVKEFPTADLATQAVELERNMLRFEPHEAQDSLTSEMRLVSQLSIGSMFDRAKHRQMLATIESFYTEHRAGFEDVARPAPLVQAMQALQADEALIEYCYPYHPLHPAIDLFIFAVTSTQVQVIPVSLRNLPDEGLIGRIGIGGQEFLER